MHRMRNMQSTSNFARMLVMCGVLATVLLIGSNAGEWNN